MGDYSAVDGVIKAWVKATGSTLFKEWADQPARFFHIPGKAPFECFQVSVGAPSAGVVTVYARAIDTNDDGEAELEQNWQGPVADLDAMLAAAIAAIEIWKERSGSDLRTKSGQ
jgi:hypothetical protein